jgi:putative spermidine/putrescine transport system ATP-binding protein
MNMDNGAYLRLRNVVKSYDGRSRAVNDISIDIKRGEFVTLLGPSGSGKTTVLMMIAGFEEPTSGTVALDGEDLARRQPYERNIGMVFQNYALFPHMTVTQNVAFPLRMRRFPKENLQRRVDEVLDLVGLKQFADKLPRELSGGQQQRVALARGLVFSPDLILLDEPLGALDRNLREQMQVEIKRIHREVGITIVHVTHDQSEAMAMSDRIAVLRNGRLEQIASPIEMYNHPTSRFVAEFVGDSNIFEAEVDRTRSGWIDIVGIGPARISNPADRRLPVSKTLDLLVRPERIRIVNGEADGLNTFDFHVETIANYGDSILVTGRVGERPVRMRMAGVMPEALREGIRLRVGWAPADAHALSRSESLSG